jgi:hypothetical protein
LRRKIKDGQCRVGENGHACHECAAVRGICRHHYDVLSSKPDILEKVALPPKEWMAKRHFEKAAISGHPAHCIIIENGVPCSRPNEYRGLCVYHRRIIGNRKDYSLKDFRLPDPEPVLRAKSPEETADGLCRVIENEKPCTALPKWRGICVHHTRLAMEQGLFDHLALPRRDRWNHSFGSGNDRPHFYLDKNVLFDHVDKLFFNTDGQAGSVELVERAMKGEIRASVSLDAIKTTYNHLRHRLMRPAEEGGRNMPEEEAESIARKHVEQTFCSGGAWRVISLDMATFKNLLVAGDGKLSLEDALEFQAYQQARSGKAGPTAFVTRDTDFPEGVHPAHLARELARVRPASAHIHAMKG